MWQRFLTETRRFRPFTASLLASTAPSDLGLVTMEGGGAEGSCLVVCTPSPLSPPRPLRFQERRSLAATLAASLCITGCISVRQARCCGLCRPWPQHSPFLARLRLQHGAALRAQPVCHRRSGFLFSLGSPEVS